MAKSEYNFKAGSLVFAKLRGFPYWPARVESKVEGTYYVYFFGTHETTALNMSNLLPFNDETKKKYGKIKRKFFAEAMDTIQKDPNFKADCVFNIPGTTVKKTPIVKPATTQRKRKPVESIPMPPPKAPREPPKRRSPPPTRSDPAASVKRERKESKRDTQEDSNATKTTAADKKTDEVLATNSLKRDSQEKSSDYRDDVKKAKAPSESLPERPAPIVYEYLNSERSPAEMGRLPLIKRREPPRDPPTASNEDVTASSAAAAIGKSEQEAFSSPIKKRKLSPPKKAPERYLEDAPQRRNSVQKKESADTRSFEESSLDTSKSPSEPKAAKITKRSSGSQAGSKKNSDKVSEYTPGQLVYAKVKGYPFWPARVNGIASSAKPVKYNIFFYGTHERAKLTAKDLVPVNAETKEKYGKPNKRSLFSEGLVEMQRNQWVDYPGSFVSSQPSQPISSAAASTVNPSAASAATAAATTTSSTAPTRQTGVEGSPTKSSSAAVQQEPQLPPVTLVPRLNVQQTSPHSPQGSSQKTGSDKGDSDFDSDSSDST